LQKFVVSGLQVISIILSHAYISAGFGFEVKLAHQSGGVLKSCSNPALSARDFEKSDKSARIDFRMLWMMIACGRFDIYYGSNMRLMFL